MLVSVMYRWLDFIACVLCRTTNLSLEGTSSWPDVLEVFVYGCVVVSTIEEPIESEIVSVVTMYRI